MPDRRNFIKHTLLAAFASMGGSKLLNAMDALPGTENNEALALPIIISTWSHGLAANEAAMQQLLNGNTVLDAVEKGVNVTEADPEINSVGNGGYPDADGEVTLDACIMGPDGNCGSVSYLKYIKHPISVARKVMEKTPHIMLSGDGALQFALAHDFRKENLLTPAMKAIWEKWKASGAHYAPEANWENHDTIGLLAMDKAGDMAGACTTSGMAFKHPGRVGDSPIIGAGLYVDNKVGAATATGEGEYIMRTLGSFMVVEYMRNGFSPGDACRKAVERMLEFAGDHEQLQIGLIAMSKSGQTGAYALRAGFQYALHQGGNNVLVDVPYMLEWE